MQRNVTIDQYVNGARSWRCIARYDTVIRRVQQIG